MLKVLLIDKDKNLFRMLKEELKRDYAVLFCDKITRALDFCRIISPDVVVLDPALPELREENITSKIRALPGKAGIPIVSISYTAQIRIVEENYKWGADYYFPKPVLPGRIRLKIEELLRKQGVKVLHSAENLLSFKPGKKEFQTELNLEFQFPNHHERTTRLNHFHG